MWKRKDPKTTIHPHPPSKGLNISRPVALRPISTTSFDLASSGVGVDDKATSGVGDGATSGFDVNDGAVSGFDVIDGAISGLDVIDGATSGFEVNSSGDVAFAVDIVVDILCLLTLKYVNSISIHFNNF